MGRGFTTSCVPPTLTLPSCQLSLCRTLCRWRKTAHVPLREEAAKEQAAQLVGGGGVAVGPGWVPPLAWHHGGQGTTHQRSVRIWEVVVTPACCPGVLSAGERLVEGSTGLNSLALLLQEGSGLSSSPLPHLPPPGTEPSVPLA